MKKFRFILLCIAAACFSVSSVACSSKATDKDDDDNPKKETSKKASSSSKNEVMISENPDFDSTMDYLEANASTFFSGLNSVMTPVDMALNGVEPSDEDAAELNTFVENNQGYFEAIGVILGLESNGQITDEQNERLEKFSDEYSEGLVNVGKLLGLGLAAQGVQ